MREKAGRGSYIRHSIAAMALLILVGTVGCAVQSEMTNLWKDPTFTSTTIHNVLVVGVRKNPVRRRIWEDAFVKGLGVRGVIATPSYQLLREAVPDTQQVIDAVQKNGYDAVLVSIRLTNEATSRYVPGDVRQELVPSRGYYGRRGSYGSGGYYGPAYYGPPGYYGNYRTHWVTIQDPGYTETDTIIQVQTDVCTTANGGRLVWSGTFRTLESVKGTADEAVSKAILPELEKEGVVPKKK